MSDDKEENELEAKFDAACDATWAEMKIIREEMNAVFERAKNLSEEKGIPVQLSGKTYVPRSLLKLFGDIEELDERLDFINVNKVTGDELPIGRWWAPSTC